MFVVSVYRQIIARVITKLKLDDRELRDSVLYEYTTIIITDRIKEREVKSKSSLLERICCRKGKLLIFFFKYDGIVRYKREPNQVLGTRILCQEHFVCIGRFIYMLSNLIKKWSVFKTSHFRNFGKYD